MTALDHYRDQIQQALKQAPMSQLPEPLATIAYLLACGNEANAAGLAEYLMPVITEEEAEMLQYYIDDPDWDMSQRNDVWELLPRLRAAALREGAG